MIQKTSILGIKYDPEVRWVIDPPEGREGNTGYAPPFPKWWHHFSIKGAGLTIGENKIQGNFIRDKLKTNYKHILSLETVDLKDADYCIDITKNMIPKQVNFIFCMAVLEHVVDVSSAIRSMSHALTYNGLLCISVPGQKFKRHRYPIDCYRFLEDAMYAFAEIGNLKLLDYTWCHPEWCAIYTRKVE